MLRMTLCEIISGNRILLKEATRGISKGKWNGLGGKIEKGETPEEGIVREVKEESGLMVKKLHRIGRINFYKGGRKNLLIRGYLFHVSGFSGRLTEGDEGRLRWFDIKSIPYEKMWNDDMFWMPLFLQGYSFDADFVYDKDMGEVIEARIRNIKKRPK